MHGQNNITLGIIFYAGIQDFVPRDTCLNIY